MNTNTALETLLADYRIYVACLASYNNGYLHGAWIDCDGKDASELQEEVNAILRTSKYPNVMVEYQGQQVPSAEEYAIHDSDGFRQLISEYTSLENVAKLVELLESVDNPNALLAFINNYGHQNDLDTVLASFEDAYYGEYDSELDYAYEFIDLVGYLDGMPEHLQSYFDYESFARDLFMDGYTYVDGYVFNDHH